METTAKKLELVEEISNKKLRSLSLGDYIRIVRTHEDLDQVQLAHRLGLPREYMCELESDEGVPPGQEEVINYFEKLGYEIDEFLITCVTIALERIDREHREIAA